MTDGIMYTWNVVVGGSHGYGVVHSCAKLETAEYLKDWCEAIAESTSRKMLELYEKGYLTYSSIMYQGKPTLEKVIAFQQKYSIVESEVIL